MKKSLKGTPKWPIENVSQIYYFHKTLHIIKDKQGEYLNVKENGFRGKWAKPKRILLTEQRKTSSTKQQNALIASQHFFPSLFSNL